MIKIIHAEDETYLRDLIKLSLERTYSEIKIDWAIDGYEALERLESGNYDLIISDYNMPRMDGLALLEAVKKDYPDIPFILLTAHERDSKEVQDAKKAGFDDYHNKDKLQGSGSIILINKICYAIFKKRNVECKITKESFPNELKDLLRTFLDKAIKKAEAENGFIRLFPKEEKIFILSSNCEVPMDKIEKLPSDCTEEDQPDFGQIGGISIVFNDETMGFLYCFYQKEKPDNLDYILKPYANSIGARIKEWLSRSKEK